MSPLSSPEKVYSILNGKYPAKAHARRVAKTLNRPDGLILLEAEKNAVWPDSDQTRTFRQARYFYYLTGCNEPDCLVTYDIGLDKLTLWLPEINEEKVVWFGRGSTVEEAMDKYDVDEARYIVRSKTFVPRSGQLYALSAVWPLASLELKTAIDYCRSIKDSYEIALIAKANDITADAHINVLVNLHSFKNEADVEAAYMQTCIENHAREQAYSVIAGSGTNGGILHYVQNDDDFGKSQNMVLDAGCEYKCYASDVTRTFPLNSKNPGYWPSKEVENIYKLVEKTQEACINDMKPGANFNHITALSQHIFIDGLLKLGILDGKHDEIFKAGTIRGFYMHGLGHHVGLEVHDSNAISPLGQATVTVGELWPQFNLYTAVDPTRAPFDDFEQKSLNSMSGNPTPEPILKPNMIMTIEPGIYFNAFLLEKFFLNDPKHKKFINLDNLKRYMPVGGVRIEDDILITEDGNDNLTTAPKGEEMLEIIRSSVAAIGA